MDREVWQDIIFGLVALTIPLAAYIGTLDLAAWFSDRSLLMLARAMTRFGWVLSIGAIGIRAVTDRPPIEHGPLWLAVVFTTGLALSCAGFLGVARHYHHDRKDR